MHRRLHAGASRLRRLPKLCRDAPSSLSHVSDVACPACTEANATHLSHRGSRYQPSYPGSLIHGDTVGPFKRSSRGHHYALILVDDHSRFKFVLPLVRKSDAPALMRKFVADFNRATGQLAGQPTRRIGHFHSDNAGEFVSREFSEFLDSSLISQSTSPPHVHDLNGVAERAIRSCMEHVRSDLAASHSPIGYWDYALEHAADILNRTTSPPDSDVSCYEALTGDKPKIMHIQPFGCQAWVVKPPHAVSKTNISPKAWVGVHLGCSRLSDNAYNVWLPAAHRVATSSDVYFADCVFPWRPAGDRIVGEVSPSPPPPDPDAAQPPGVPSKGATDTSTVPPPRPEDSVASAFADATGRRRASRGSRAVLVLFSGAYARPDGLGAFLTKNGFDVTLVDNDVRDGGGESHDILRDAFFDQLLDRVRQGYYFAVIAAPPCSTFSIARFFDAPAKGNRKDKGPRPVRDRKHPLGLPNLNVTQLREVDRANRITNRTCVLLAACHEVGTHFILENPADRGDPAEKTIYLSDRHAPLWKHPTVISLQAGCAARLCTFAMCAFGAPFQKYTTLMYSAGLAPLLDSLDRLRCTHKSHANQVGGGRNDNGRWDSAGAAAYPADFNLLLARGLRDLRYGEWRDRGGVSDRAHHPKPSEPDHVAPDNVEPLRNALNAPAPSPPAPAPPPSPAPPAEPAPNTDDPAGDSAPLPSPVTASTAPGTVPPDTSSPSASKPRRHRRTQAEMAASIFDRGSTIGTRARVTIARDQALCAGALLLSSWQTIAADGLSHGRSLKATAGGDPRNHREAMATDEANWRPAETSELENHRSNGTWTEIDFSEVPADRRRLVRMTWAYKTKRSGKKKARLCVQGCSQVAGVDFDQTFCATMRSSTLRLLCAISSKWGLHMRRWDFVAAYLQGTLEEGEVVYCSLPPGYEHRMEKGVAVPNVGADGRSRVLRIEKPCYGMAQAGRRWQRSLFPWLLSHGFTQHDSDECVFSIMKETDGPAGKRHEKLIVGCYVDDMFTAYSHDDEQSLYHQFTDALQTAWDVEDEGPVNDLLNVEISRTDNCVSLRQTAYIERMVTAHFPDGVPNTIQSNSTPCSAELPSMVLEAMERVEGPCPKLLQRYQSIVGGLLYCSTNTRPDIAYSVGMLCRAMSRPTPELLDAALRVLGYLYRTRELGLNYVAEMRPLAGMTDSDWATKHSTSGWVFQYCRAAVSWGCEKQKSVALSSCEAEIMAASEAAKEAIYLKRFLEQFGLQEPGDPVALACDNQAAINLSYNPEHHKRVKHIERRHFFIREKVEENLIEVPYVRTIDNLADFFTKPLSGDVFFSMRDQIMNCGKHTPMPLQRKARGG